MEGSTDSPVRVFIRQLAAVIRAARNGVQRHRRLSACLSLLLVAYVGSYVWLFRRGFAESQRFGVPGFHYFTAEDSDEWRRKQHICAVLFAPLNKIDCWLGTGMEVAHEPLWSLE
jgi:hypothetical protein